jgi:hypothetical protein
LKATDRVAAEGKEAMCRSGILWASFLGTGLATALSVSTVRAQSADVDVAHVRFLASDPGAAYEVTILQNGHSVTCADPVTDSTRCDVWLAVGEAEVKVSGSRGYSFKHDYRAGLTEHHLAYRSRWPVYVGAGLLGAGIAAFALGAQMATQCADGTWAEKVSSCGGDKAGYALGAVLSVMGLGFEVWGLLGTGDRTRTESPVQTAATPVAPKLRAAPERGGGSIDLVVTF